MSTLFIGQLRPQRFRFALLLAIELGLAAPHALAAGAPHKPLAQSLSGEAKASYESAKLLFEDGDHAGALTKFKRAYDFSQDPRLLWNMAVCEKELRHYARSAALVSQYLKEGGGVISAEQRRSATETQVALRAFYSSVNITGAPEGATLSVDGNVVGRLPLAEPLLLDLGPRRIRVEQAGYAPFETTVNLPGASALDVPVVLRPEVEAPAAPPRLSVTTSGAQDIVSIDAKVMGSRHWEGALAVGEHVVRVTAAHKKPYELHLQLAAGSSRSLQVTLEDEAHSSTLWYWVAGGATVAAGAIVGGYFLLRPKDEPGSHPNGALATIFLPSSGTATATNGGQR